MVLRVVIASPSDVPEARDAVEKALHDWNDANATTKGTVLLPWRWETSSVPLLGDHPQALINSQGVDSADIVIALFGSRLGSPTPDAVSGTVEEIERAVASSKPVHLYFSDAPLPNDVDTVQLDGLREFKAEISGRGLLGRFTNVGQLTHEVWKAIEHDVSTIASNLGTPVQGEPNAVKFRVQSRREREQEGIDKRGKVKYKTRRWFEVTNIGGASATEVTFSSSATAGLMRLTGTDDPVTIEPGTSWRVPVVYSSGSSGAKLLINWVDDGEKKSESFDVQ